MMYKLVTLLVAASLSCSLKANNLSRDDHPNTIAFVIPSFEPYTFEQNNQYKGIGVDLVTTIMATIGQKFTIRLVPNYGRALQEVTRGKADGFFLASENKERNLIAVFSKPLTYNRWSWFFHRESPLSSKSLHFKEEAKIGTFLHTNTHKWLIKNGYQDIRPITKVGLLPRMLAHGRLQSVFLAEAVFKDVIAKSDQKLSLFRQEVEISKPFGIYISKAYIEKRPDFMAKLNKAITDATQ